MARILIAWELGEALGHLARCARLAEALHARGHRVVLAVKDLRGIAASRRSRPSNAPSTPSSGGSASALP